MSGMRYRLFGLFLSLALTAGVGTVAAEEVPDEDDLDIEESEEAADDEEISKDASDEDDVDAEEESSEDSARSDEWETPLRDPIPAILNSEGSMGFHGIASAISPGPLNFQVGLLAETSGGGNFIRHNDDHRSLTGRVVINASFLDYFAAHAGIEARNNLNTYGRPQAMLAQGDTVFGVTGRYPVSPGIWLGGDLNMYVPSAFGGVGVSVPSATVRPRLLASFDVDQIMGAQSDLYVPVIGHINLGYRFDNSESLIPEGTRLNRLERHAYGISAYDMLEMGVGAEFPLPYVTPYLGWTLGIPVNPTGDVCAEGRALNCVGDVGGAAFPQQLTLGAKGEPVENLGLHLGLDLGLTGQQAEGLPATLPYAVHFGVSWNIDPLSGTQTVEKTVETEIEVEPIRGVLLGRILDQESGEPVEGAKILYRERDVTAQLSGDETGLFHSYAFEPGEIVELEFEHPRYEATQASWTVEEGSEEMEFLMDPVPFEGLIRGQVFTAVELDEDSDEVDSEAQEAQVQPLAGARILIRGGNGAIYEVETDEDGRFEKTILAGDTTVAAVAEGYLTAGRFVEVGDDSEIDVELTLNAVEERLAEFAEMEINIEGRVHFETGESTLLERSGELLDHVAAAILENPGAESIEIQGHTDDAGEEEELLALSKERAESVRQALIERGVSPEQLDAAGYGSASPILPNTSSRNRSMNRRIEFHIVN